jgi:EAL domain-containing protein (putative c-di-GMP-specific phosphodiesterase class I)
MISLARVLNIHVVAKGAETKTQMDALSDMECEYVQGFYISHPLTSQEMENYLKP